MTDPKPPRPFPPPLPGAMREPFEKAKSDPPPGCCPFVRSGGFHGEDCNDLGRGPCTWSPPVNRAAITPASGTPIYDPDPRDGMIRDLQRELVLLREQLDQGPETPVPLTRPSVRARRAATAKALGKWAALITFLPLVGGVVAKRWPEYSEIVDLVLQLVGLK